MIAGGVSANSHIRAAAAGVAAARGVPLYLPPLSLCGDNAAMVAAEGYYAFLAGKRDGADLNASAV